MKTHLCEIPQGQELEELGIKESWFCWSRDYHRVLYKDEINSWKFKINKFIKRKIKRQKWFGTYPLLTSDEIGIMIPANTIELPYVWSCSKGSPANEKDWWEYCIRMKNGEPVLYGKTWSQPAAYASLLIFMLKNKLIK